ERTARTTIPRADTVTDVFPVLIVQEPVLGFGAVSKVLSDWFQNAIARYQKRVRHATPKIWPLAVIHIDELDLLSAAAEASHVRLDAVLKRFHRTFPSRARGFSELLQSRNMADAGFPNRVSKIVGSRFAARIQNIFERVRAGEYG